MSTQPTDAMIEAGYKADREAWAKSFTLFERISIIYLAMQSAHTPPPCAGDDVERVTRAIELKLKLNVASIWTAGSNGMADAACERLAPELANVAIAALGTTPSIVGQEPVRKRPGEFTGQAYRENL